MSKTRTKRNTRGSDFVDSDAPTIIRDLLQLYGFKTSHAVGPIEYRQGMNTLLRPIDVVDTFMTIENDEALVITGRKLLRSMDNTQEDTYVLIEPRIGQSLCLSRLDFMRGNEHLNKLVAAWSKTCEPQYKFTCSVIATLQRNMTQMCHNVCLISNICNTSSIIDDNIVYIIVGRAVQTVATSYITRPELSDLSKVSNVAILVFNEKFLPIIEDNTTDDIVQEWYLLDRETDDNMHGLCVVCDEPAELGVDIDDCAHVCNSCHARVCRTCMDMCDYVVCPICKHNNYT